MTPYEAFQLYSSIKLHFSSESYNYFKFNGKIRYSPQAFSQRNDRYFFEKLAKHKDPKGLILSNVLDGNVVKWAGGLFEEQAELIYTNWLKRNQSLTYIFKQQISLLDADFNSNFIFKFNYPILLKLFLDNKICYEVILILDNLVSYLINWNKKLQGDVVFDAFYMKCQKYKGFMKYDKKIFKTIVIGKFSSK